MEWHHAIAIVSPIMLFLVAMLMRMESRFTRLETSQLTIKADVEGAVKADVCTALHDALDGRLIRLEKALNGALNNG